MRSRPLSSEYPAYYERYVSLVPDGDIEDWLNRQGSETHAFLSRLTEEDAERAYAPGKWTLKEVIGHLSDTERVMAYRMLAMARGELVSLQGMDQELYVSSAHFNQLTLAQLLKDLGIMRSATISLLSTIDDDAWVRTGTVWDSPVTTRAIAYIIAGHELHHLKVIRDNYL
ncbi:DinB family protein [Pullulanibacillus sp. KACC 23026]|uniref:DinB family protein n=1 Tax=Pullulanibacillus sp. KACC 23026 TaxID=3028315 RepID=UPI0023B0FB04|nr:DinB family protein [Pullulanibacillus sp. KACC 23026]WEG10945.1 DinB family protein [Pullulanibacillus sp. KACC 23026]